MHRSILYTQIMERTDCGFLITMEEKSSKNITYRQRTQRAKRIPKSLKLEVPKILNYQDYWQRELCSHYSYQLGWLLAAHEHKPAHTGELRVLLSSTFCQEFSRQTLLIINITSYCIILAYA